MKRINCLSDLLIEELADLLNAENQLVEALPKMVQAGEPSALKAALENCLDMSREHIDQLQDIFGNMRQNPPKMTCTAIKGFIAESEDAVNKTEKGPHCDAGIISVMKRVENYKITAYLIAYEHTMDLGYTRIMKLLHKMLNEERVINFHLNELAQGMINIQAIDPNGSR